MLQRISDGSLVPLLGFGILGMSCSGDVSVGRENRAFNLSRCYGSETRCLASKPATIAAETGIVDCPEEQVGILDPELTYADPPGGFQTRTFEVGVDGSVWALGDDGGNTNIRLAHWSPEGVFLGISEILAVPAEHTTQTVDLALDGAGHALVSVLSLYAVTADDPANERATIHVLDGGLQEVREPLLFRGSRDAMLVGGAGDSFTMAGDSTGSASPGVLTHVSAGEPDWIQTTVPSSGFGAGVGVSALALSVDGEASVVAQRSPRWQPGSPDVYSYGVARFDDRGNLLWNLVLPSAYSGGSLAYAEPTPNGDVVVRGVLASDSLDDNRSLVRLVTRDGRLGWAFRLTEMLDATLSVDQTGRTFAGAFKSIAVISAEGQTCKQYGLPPPVTGGTNFPNGLRVARSSVYVGFQGGVRRYRIPAE